MKSEDERMQGPQEEGSEAEEARPARLACGPGAPTRAEYERRMATHMPCRAWCPWCVTGRGSGSQQGRAQQDQARGVPTVEMDSCHIMEGNSPVLCLKCSHTSVIAAHATASKEVTPELVRLVARDIDNMGHQCGAQ